MPPEACSTLSALDPSEVYLIGTVAEGSCGQDVLAHWSNPNVAVSGFGCYNHPPAAIIRPSDGALLISDTFAGTSVFEPDACVTREGWFGDNSAPLANDGKLASPCPQPSPLLGNLVLLAPSGIGAFWCGASWFSSSGEVLHSGERSPLAYDGERFLTTAGVIDIASRVTYPLVDLPEANVLTTRVVGDGFWVVLDGTTLHGAALWHVARDGHAELVGEYPAPPARSSPAYRARLSGDGALFQLATDVTAEQHTDLIIVRSLSGASDVVYDEADEPLVRIHISGLVTGP
jgi:hypothetical protein